MATEFEASVVGDGNFVAVIELEGETTGNISQAVVIDGLVASGE